MAPGPRGCPSSRPSLEQAPGAGPSGGPAGPSHGDAPARAAAPAGRPSTRLVAIYIGAASLVVTIGLGAVLLDRYRKGEGTLIARTPVIDSHTSSDITKSVGLLVSGDP